MFIDKDSIMINNVSFGQYILSAKYGYHKLWASDTGRNLAGVNTGTLIGIFPKITLQFRKLTKTELEAMLRQENKMLRFTDNGTDTKDSE